MKCTVEGCPHEATARGLCNSHYGRWKRNGDPLIQRRVALHGYTLRQRFDHYLPNRPKRGCWGWTGYKDRHGYGQLTIDQRPVFAHRLAYEFFCGPIPEGDAVLHRCDNPPCCKPSHLFLGSQRDNMRDMTLKGRHGQRKLTEATVQEIRASTGKCRDVAKQYGISATHVSEIRTGKSWAHLKP